jgi:hypothetical protein
MTEITCACERSFEVDIPDSVDLATQPKATDEIIAGTFLTFTCPHCGNQIKPEFPFHVFDSSDATDIFMIPEIERDRFLLGISEHTDHERVVIGFSELAERLLIRRAGLDDRAVELIKYYLLIKAGPTANPQIFFRKVESEDLILEILGMKADEVGVARIPRKLYDSALQDLSTKIHEDPYRIILEPPYVSITKIEIAEEE